MSNVELIENLEKKLEQVSRDARRWRKLENPYRTELTASQEECCTREIVLQHRASGRIEPMPNFCRSWGCETCGPYNAREKFVHLAWTFLQLDAVFFAKRELSMKSPREEVTRLRKMIKERASRMRKKEGVSVDYVTVYRAEWTFREPQPSFWVFSTSGLWGNDWPIMQNIRKLPPIMAVQLLQVALMQPGLEPGCVSVSKGWQVKERHRKYRKLAHVKRGITQQILDFLGIGGVGSDKPDKLRDEFLRELEKRGGEM